MKIVLAEKVSPATLAVFQQELGWDIVTHDQIKNGLAAELGNADALVVRSAVQVDDALLEAAPIFRTLRTLTSAGNTTKGRRFTTARM